ncbi:MAG: fibronectin type III domain-containing protein, partial [Magnetococcus sp. WYHC-3]
SPGDGTSGQVLSSLGNGSFAWSNASSGTVGNITAGDGLSGGGNGTNVTLNLTVDNATLAISNDTVAVAALGINTSQLANASVTGVKLAGSPGDGTSGQVLSSLGNGSFAWANTSSGTVGNITAGDGLSGGGNGTNVTLNLTVDNATLAIVNDTLLVSDFGISSDKIGNATVNTTKLTGSPGNGTSGQVLSSLGNGSFAWADASSGGGNVTVTAGSGLSGGGTGSNLTLNVTVDNATLAITNDTLLVKDDGVTSAKVITNVTALSSNTTLNSTHAGVLLVSGNTSITLPAAADVSGKSYTFKKTDSGTTTTLVGVIDGTTNATMTSQYDWRTIVSDGSNWYMVAQSASASILDTTNPTVGNSGTLSTSNGTSSTVQLSWTAASDDGGGLEYAVFYSTSDVLTNVTSTETNGTPLNIWVGNLTSYNVTNLTVDTPYYFNVVVKDSSSNKAVYDNISYTPSPDYIVLYGYDANVTASDIGNRTHADALCANSTNKPSSFSNFGAFISYNSSDQLLNATAFSGINTTRAVKNAAGNVTIAANWTDLWDGTIQTTLAVAGTNLPSTYIWTGTRSNGTSSGESCSNWTQTSNMSQYAVNSTSYINYNYGTYGDASMTGSSWVSSGNTSDCNYEEMISFLCIAW